LLVGALQACATKPPPRASAPRRPATSGAPVKLAVLPSDPLLFADVATALDRQLAQARLSGVGPTVRAKISMEVAQLALECVSPTDGCYAQVGRFLQVDRLLWGSIARGPQAVGVRVTVVLLDVARGAPVARAEATFPQNEAAIGGLRKLVDQATGALEGGAPRKLVASRELLRVRLLQFQLQLGHSDAALEQLGVLLHLHFCLVVVGGNARGGRAQLSRPRASTASAGTCGRCIVGCR